MTLAEPFCPACHARLQEGDRFCEQCGTPLGGEGATTAGCPAYGAEAGAIDADGYCSVCGVRAPSSADRIELDLTIAAAVSDRGRVHRRNEDAFFLEVAADRTVTIVVCDGISTASAGNVAARDAAQAAGKVLAGAMADPARDAGDATAEALLAAHGAVEQVGWTTRTRRVDPSCTLVSALCRGGEIVIGWAGDSRAYWVDSEGARQLTVDDSWAEEGIAKGMLTPEQAARSPFMHSITNWVGPDAPTRTPHLLGLTAQRSGRLVLCTDGLWNYAPTQAELAELIATVPAGAAPATVARALIEVALTRGGRDNITVAVVDFEPS
jgi:serine/threonine protein phosphatase PrpC